LRPGSTVSELDRGLAYSDAMADDARLTLAVAATAHHYGAHLLTRCEVTGAQRAAVGGAIAGVLLHDLTDGRTHRVRARVVVNATGGLDRRPPQPARPRGRPGAAVARHPPHHRRDRLPIEVAVTLLAPDDGRPVFLIPHPEGVLVGTTDHYHDGALGRPTADRRRGRLPATCRSRRVPGPASDSGRPCAARSRACARSSTPTPTTPRRRPARRGSDEDGALSVAGGKLTTWRSTAEEAVDAALRLMPEEETRRFAPCATKGTPLAGLAPADLAERLMRAFEIDAAVARAWLAGLGALAWTAAAAARRHSELRPVAPDTDLCRPRCAPTSGGGAVIHLEDLLLRRVRLGMWDPEQAVAMLRPLRPILRSRWAGSGGAGRTRRSASSAPSRAGRWRESARSGKHRPHVALRT